MGIQSVKKAITILELFKERQSLGLAEITDLMGVPKTTLHTILITLEQSGFLKKDTETKKYQLGYDFLELGIKQINELEINRRAFQPLQKLSNDLETICSVGVWDNKSVVVTMRTFPQGNEVLTGQIGPRIPAYCTPLGKVILAYLPKRDLKQYLDTVDLIQFTPNTITDKDKLLEDLGRIREQGYSIADRELIHLIGIGAPIMSYSGKLEGAISVRLNLEDYDRDNINKIAGPLVRKAYEISMDMGYQPVSIKNVI